jgi:glycerophosphoryl diester phosphodiesterase
MRRFRIIGILILFFIALWYLGLYYANIKLSKRSYPNIYNACDKIWSSRGLYHTKEEQNSLSAFKRAFDAGAQGAELDFHYDAYKDRFIISHDHPKKDAEGHYIYPKKEGELLTLEMLFKTFGTNHYFWLDYKNLDDLDSATTQKAIARLHHITKGSLKKRLYIEGSNPLKLSRYTKAGFKTILGIHPLPEAHPLASITNNGYKMVFAFSNVSALAMAESKRGKRIYGAQSAPIYQGIPLFLFHVQNDEARLHNLVLEPDVRVMLVGRDESVARFNISSCKR